MKRFALAAALTALFFAAPAEADILELEDGRLVEGTVLQDGETYLVTDRFGVVEIPVAEVKSWEKGKSVDQLVQEHLAKLDEDDVAGRMALARWLTALGRQEEACEIAKGVLESAPENEAAHTLLGHVRHRGKWVTPDEAKRAEGYEQHGGRWFTPAEWENLAKAEKEKAAAAEEAEAKARVNAEVNRAVRLMMSPDPAVRMRGKALLEALAEEHDSDALRELIGQVEDHVRKVEELRAKAAGVSGGLVPSPSGMVLGEIRATMSKLKRPIQVFETSLASNIGGAPVRIMLPELEVVKVRTTVGIPAEVK